MANHLPTTVPVQPPGMVPGATPPAGRDQDALDLGAIWGVVRRRWALILGMCVTTVGVGWLLAGWTTPVYQASATVRIAEKEPAILGLDLLKELGAGQAEVSTEMEVLRSRSLADRVVRELRLQLVLLEPARGRRSSVVAAADVDSAAPAGAYRFTRQPDGSFQVTQRDSAFRLPGRRYPESVLGQAMAGRPFRLPGVTLRLAPEAAERDEFMLRVLSRSRAVDALQKRLAVSRPNRDANIISVRYRGSDPEIVRDVPNALVSAFIRERVQVQKTGARSTVGFLRSQLDTLSRQLRRAEDSLRAFREAEQVVSLAAEAGSQVERFAELQAERTSVEAERAALERLVAEARAAQAPPQQVSPYRRLLAFPTLLKNPAAASLLSSLTELDNERAELLRRRTPQDPDVVALTGAIRDLESQVQDIVLTYLAGLRQQVASLDASLAGFGKRLEKIPSREVQHARLQRSSHVLGELYTLLQTRLKESEIVQAIEDPSAQVVDRAFLPEIPVAPRKGLTLFLAGFLGLGLGLAGAFGREWLDTTIHRREDVQGITGVPLLGLIPHIQDPGARYRFARLRRVQPRTSLGTGGALTLAAGRDPRGTISEAYRALRTNLAFARPERPPKTVAFTSPAPADGKSTSVANLAVTLAQQGLQVLVIDADLRRGYLHQVFGALRAPGLSELLVGRVEAELSIQEIDLGPDGRLHLIATGAWPPNPAELLGSNRLRQVLERLEPRYDAILIDCPPINVVTDAAVVGTQTDGMLLVARAGKTQRGELALSMEQLRTVRVQVLGTVLNDFDHKRSAGYGGDYYAYSYSYMSGDAA